MHARPFFLDTNVLVYAYTSQSNAKSEVANALIVAAALDAGCTLLLSEDMQHDMVVETLRIQNPFLLA